MIALLVGGAPAGGASELLFSLASGADVVIAVDRGAQLCRAAGVSPGVVVGDMDSVDPSLLSSLRASGIPLVTFPADKDVTDLDLAFEHARSLGVNRTILTAVTGGRLDHTLASLGTCARNADLAPVIEERDVTIRILSPAGVATCQAQPAAATLSLVALLGDAVVGVEGVRWPLEQAVLEPLSTYAVSNVVTNAWATITVSAGVIAVIAETVDGVRAQLM